MGRLRRGVSLLVILVAASLSGRAAGDELRGVALVIGAADYEQLGDLTNTLNDARAMDEMLGDLGFDVTRVLDRDGDRLRREIEDFIADAEGADVALVYYAGHAVEAAGQNYLVPIDADISTPQLAGQSLVAVSDLLDELARTVPVTIMLLDACRSEAFPDGAAIQLPGSDAAIPLAATGLGEMRGPAPVAQVNVAPDSLGMVIGFASAPGQPALDGEPGGNSPYAAALLKHFAAGGYAFGDLMTMVTEEVYLKTGARQVPWMNSSLRRVLSFGAPIESDGDEALIRDGRRQLLLSIATMPAAVRQQVQNAADEAAVPMDALYGLLDALGEETPADPGELDQLLRKQTETVRALIDERQTLSSTDAEIVRLASLAQQAFDEGALAVSIGFWENAKARYASLSTSLDATEDLLKARRLEGGDLLARTARTYGISGDFAAAAENFRLAYAEVERWDDELAVAYKEAEGDALYELGVQAGDKAGLRGAVAAYQAALGLVQPDNPHWPRLQRNIGNGYAQLAERDADDASITAAIGAYELALGAIDREAAPAEWAMTMTRLAASLSIRAERDGDAAGLLAAIDGYQAALERLSPESHIFEWGMAQNNLGNTLRIVGDQQSDPASLLTAADAFRAALSVADATTRPYDWALIQNNLGGTLLLLGTRTGDRQAFVDAAATLRAALELMPRERMPLMWAQTQGNLGSTLTQLGNLEPGTALFMEAELAFRGALEEFSPERSLIDWVTATINLGNVQAQLGMRGGDDGKLAAAVQSYRTAAAAISPEQAPLQWALAQNNLGSTLNLVGERSGDPAVFGEALTALQRSLDIRTRDRLPHDWAMVRSNMGNVLSNIGSRETGTETLLSAVAAYRDAASEQTRERMPAQWADLQIKIGNVLYEIGWREGSGVERYREALEAYDAATGVYTADTNPLLWASIANSAGWTLAQAGYRAGDRATMAQGRSAIAAAWDIVRGNGITDQDGYFSERLAMIDEVLAAAQPAP